MFETPRLHLIPMGAGHMHGLNQMNADPEVMAHFPDVMTHAQSAAHLGRMQRLNMQSNPFEDFEHPMLALGHPLSWHVLCRLQNPHASQSLRPR